MTSSDDLSSTSSSSISSDTSSTSSSSSSSSLGSNERRRRRDHRDHRDHRHSKHSGKGLYKMNGMGPLISMYGGAAQQIEENYQQAKSKLIELQNKLNKTTDSLEKSEYLKDISLLKDTMKENKKKLNGILGSLTSNISSIKDTVKNLNLSDSDSESSVFSLPSKV